MAGTAKKKAVNQNDLRKLMQERRGLSKSDERKINSPYAKYNSRGQLSCTACNTVIKTENLWPSHVLNKTHKQNVNLGRERESRSDSANTCNNGKRKAEFSLPETKRLLTGKQSIDEKELLVERETNDIIEKKLSLMRDYSSSGSDTDNETKNDEGLEVMSNKNDCLPSDFFDNQPSQASEAPGFKRPTNPAEKDEIPTINAAEELPEGFFDDPVLDAKARKVEFKDPMEEEWENFQKTIAEESHVSEAIIEGDAVESTVERDIDQIDEQIRNWSIIKALQVKNDQINQLIKPREDDEESGGSSDYEEYGNIMDMDWRAKDY